jgi:hypothetical protein
MLVHRALHGEDSMQAELVFLKGIPRGNSYKDLQIHRVLIHHLNFSQADNKPN